MSALSINCERSGYPEKAQTGTRTEVREPGEHRLLSGFQCHAASASAHLYHQPVEEKKQVDKWWGAKYGKPQKYTKINGFGSRYCGSMACMQPAARLSSAGVNRTASASAHVRECLFFMLVYGILYTNMEGDSQLIRRQEKLSLKERKHEKKKVDVP